YGRRELLESMPPFHGGGDMIETVAWEKTTYAPLPNKFEAGTPDICGVIGLGAAIDYVSSIGFDALIAHEHDLLAYASQKMQSIPGLRILGTAKNKGGVISFVMETPAIASLDIGVHLDAAGIAVRTGHHCGMPLMKRLGVSGTTRVSLAMYNTRQDIDSLVEQLQLLVKKQCILKTPSASPASAGLELIFSKASGVSPQAVADELAEIFEFLGERDERNQQLLDFGRELPDYFKQLKLLTQRVPGCMSEVYIIGRKTPGTNDRFEFVADADAHIVRGEIAILQKLYSGQKAQDVLDFDIEAFFNRIGLEQFLSSQRRNGLAGMVKRIRTDAMAIVKQS
ncbi:MAG TPA: aminotransferase class V-fold PLP-dependent enzyme, partial [Tepidisphaeraceae bacterium]|nr:aminotransferase class V-fold PLP-dependent enzyme [Tepidisphaeraceae bacterium]